MPVCQSCSAEYPEDLDACPACGTLAQPVACETHPDRDAIGRCVVCGRALCADCREGNGRVHLCERHSDVTVIEGWAQVYSPTNEFEAQLIQENLKASDIDAQVFSQRDRAFSVDLGELNVVRVLVPVWDYERALKVVRANAENAEGVRRCNSCGQPVYPESSECPECGMPVD